MALARDLASLARADLRREAVFFLRRSFLTALSYSLWTFLMFSAEGSALKALRASLMSRLMAWFLAVRLVAWRAAFLADFMMGIRIPVRLVMLFYVLYIRVRDFAREGETCKYKKVVVN